MRDYAGFGYASLDLVMYPLNLCEIMRDLVMPRWIWLCLVGFGYVSYGPMQDYASLGYASLLFWLCLVCLCCLCCFGYVLIVGYVLCIISMILYYIKDITYDLI